MPEPKPAETGSKTIVVVDDELEIRETLRDIFENEGYQVLVAADGVAALGVLRGIENRSCIVILDIIMPRMDGNEVYRAMRADPRLSTIPVVVSTSDPSRAPSGVLIVRKPVNVDLLLKTVRRCC